MKNTINLLIAAAILSCGNLASAANFDLGSVSAKDVSALSYDKKAPVPQQDPDDLIGIDLTVRLPFKFLKNAVEKMAASDKRLTILDAAAPVVSKSGEYLKISNIRVDAGGIIVEPTLTLKISMEGTDKVAILIKKVQIHASMGPDQKAMGEIDPATLNQEEIMQKVMDVMISGVYGAVNAKLKAKNIPMKAEKVIAMKYDKGAWILHSTVSAKVVQYLIPAGIVGDLHLTGFLVTSTGMNVTVQTAE